jgi:hypothetical protein
VGTVADTPEAMQLRPLRRCTYVGQPYLSVEERTSGCCSRSALSVSGGDVVSRKKHKPTPSPPEKGERSNETVKPAKGTEQSATLAEFAKGLSQADPFRRSTFSKVVADGRLLREAVFHADRATVAANPVRKHVHRAKPRRNAHRVRQELPQARYWLHRIVRAPASPPCAAEAPRIPSRHRCLRLRCGAALQVLMPKSVFVHENAVWGVPENDCGFRGMAITITG